MSDPIFKSVFGPTWDAMPRVFKRHYANRGHSDDVSVVDGVMDVMCAGPLWSLRAFLWAAGSIPPANEKGVRTVVSFRSMPRDGHLRFERVFHFAGRRPYRFNSRMVPLGGADVLEVTGPGAGWICAFSSEGSKIVMRHKGYGFYAFGLVFRLPLEWLMGEGYAEEVAVDDDVFDMVMHLTHPKYGRIYEYKGRFRVTKDA